MMSEVNQTWWGSFELALNQSAQWHVGPLLLYVKRGQQEWYPCYRYLSADEVSQDLPLLKLHADFPEDLSKMNASRHVFTQTAGKISVMPALGDRPLVVQPQTPCVIHPGESVLLYLSSPIWLKVSAEARQPQVLEDLPTRRLSDTWFGPTTLIGELCYASKSRALISLEGIEREPFRAVSPVKIQNQSEKALKFDRLSLPLPLLDLYQDENQQFWTQELTLMATQELSIAELKFAGGAPKYAKSAKLLTPARQKREKGLLVRAFGAIF